MQLLSLSMGLQILIANFPSYIIFFSNNKESIAINVKMNYVLYCTLTDLSNVMNFAGGMSVKHESNMLKKSHNMAGIPPQERPIEKQNNEPINVPKSM